MKCLTVERKIPDRKTIKATGLRIKCLIRPA